MFGDRKLIRFNRADNVAVALTDIGRGEEPDLHGIRLKAEECIGRGHKIALCDIAENGNIIKYGCPIGHAVRNIRAGEHVHMHNIATNLGGLIDYTYTPRLSEYEMQEPAHFNGYLREDGQAGVRNEIWIVPTVGCANKTAEMLASEANRLFGGMTDVEMRRLGRLFGNNGKSAAWGVFRHACKAGRGVYSFGST